MFECLRGTRSVEPSIDNNYWCNPSWRHYGRDQSSRSELYNTVSNTLLGEMDKQIRLEVIVVSLQKFIRYC